ncbi:Saccharopine dehydrogenase-domain-containing protein [Obelidium mucronatum]|nr:Saccharopine dehydrogenase-domain-containing protein [Obelidium mucronatum]
MTEKGATFWNIELTRVNLASVLNKAFQTGDDTHDKGRNCPRKEPRILIDLTVGIGCSDVVKWCAREGVCYVNTALELWEDAELNGDWLKRFKETGDFTGARDRTLFARQSDLKTLIEDKENYPRFTAVIDHGMNPGLVSHFTKLSLVKIAKDVLIRCAEMIASSNAICSLRDAVRTNNYAVLAQILSLKTIHISEKDTQVPIIPKSSDEFLSTWSPAGFHEEGLDPVQVGWGTHERDTMNAGDAFEFGPQLVFAKRGIDVVMKSFVGGGLGEIQGYNIPHSEGATIAQFLSVVEKSEKMEDKVLYRPTVHYVYSPPQCAVESWSQVLTQSTKHKIHEKTRVLEGRDIQSGGKDAVGVLMIFETSPLNAVLERERGQDIANGEKKPWYFWAGSVLDVDRVAEDFKNNGVPAPTTVQVCSSIMSVVKWMLKGEDNRQRGLLWPEQLPSEEIMEYAEPWLGHVVFEAVEWEGGPKSCLYRDHLLAFE